jgi:coenzyme F420-reducing hydrogenase beta subunit
MTRDPEPPDRVSPREVVGSDLCIGCGACAGGPARGVGARMRQDSLGQYKPAGPSSWLRAPTRLFARTCPFSPAAANEDDIAAARFPEAPQRDPALGRHETAYVGATADEALRARGSSGGMVTWTAVELLERGLVDAIVHVGPTGGLGFGYRISRTLDEVRAGAKSRYHPVELSGVLNEIRARPGRYAVVGVPCFVKALHLLRAAEPVLAERIVLTLGLFCGHSKSARMAESFAWQMGARPEAVESFDYRVKDAARPANWYAADLTLKSGERRRKDWWHMADGDWGAGFFQNPACDACDDVTAETADIAFGDAWIEPYASDGRGTNVVIVRSPVLARLVQAAIAQGRLALEPLAADRVAETQAAGLRHRREGLAYRLTWPRRGLRPRKRVQPRADGLPTRRKLVYRLRAHIRTWSHRMFWFARVTHMPLAYVVWARSILRLYQALTYSRGPLGRLFDRLLPQTR